MRVLSVDIGGSNVKCLAQGRREPRKFPSGPTLTPGEMVAGVLAATKDWTYDAVTIGYPGPVVQGARHRGIGDTKFFGDSFDRRGHSRKFSERMIYVTGCMPFSFRL